MKLIVALLLTILNLTVYGQKIIKPVDYSPNKNFGLLIIIGDEELFPEWSYYLLTNSIDTILLTTSMTHDEKPPVTYWNKTSEILIIEEQSEGDQREEGFKLYNLLEKKVVFETPGFIWGEGKNNFDQNRGLLFYFKHIENKSGVFDLLSLNIETREIKKLSSIVTSGDPMTGAPEIESLDIDKKQFVLIFETTDFKFEKKKINY